MVYNIGLDEFISNSFGIPMLKYVVYSIETLTFSRSHQVVCLFYTFPSFIPVHGIVSTNDTCNFHRGVGDVLFKVIEESSSTLWVTISAVCKSMDVNFF